MLIVLYHISDAFAIDTFIDYSNRGQKPVREDGRLHIIKLKKSWNCGLNALDAHQQSYGHKNY